MTASSKNFKWVCGYLLWLLAATVIGALLSSLACSQFQQHVRVFYPRGTPNSTSMQCVADLAVGLHPFALVGPALGPSYYCWRNGLTTIYLFMFAIPGAVAGFLLSPSIQGMPDQSFIYTVPGSVFVATVLALVVEVVRADWVADAPAAIRPKHFHSRSQR